MAANDIEIGLLTYPGVQQATLHGLTDLFSTANSFTPGVQMTLHVSHWQWQDAVAAVAPVNVQPQQATTPLTVLIVPPSLEDEPVHSLTDAVLDWIDEQHRAGTVVCSICKAAFVLARCGLLDARVATTHWALADEFQAEFPQVHLRSDQLVVDDGDIITAGGVMAWIDLGLYIIERFLSPAVMLEVSRFFLIDPPGREQRLYHTFTPRFDHGDDAVLKAQRIMEKQIAEPVSQHALASAVALSERTLLRRFMKTLGVSPTSYLQKLRVNKARNLLELTNASWNEISWQVGYEDPGALRKVFTKIIGLKPADYRKRFARRIANKRQVAPKPGKSLKP